MGSLPQNYEWRALFVGADRLQATVAWQYGNGTLAKEERSVRKSVNVSIPCSWAHLPPGDAMP